MGWHLLETLLQQVGEHSTLVGKLWVTATFVFRFIIVASVGDAVYSDEQSDFNCNTQQPGCENVCFNQFSPISHLRFWAAQIIAVCTPSIVFIVYAAHVLLSVQHDDEEYEDDDYLTEELPITHRGSNRKGGKMSRKPSVKLPGSTNVDQPKPKESLGLVRGFANPPGEATDMVEEIKKGDSEDEDDSAYMDEIAASLDEVERQLAAVEQEEKVKRIKKRVQYVYVVALLLRTGSEAVFIWLQIVLYGFSVTEIYPCNRTPCPHVVDCFVSRPREKTFFLWFMFGVSCLCLALNVIEIKYLGIKKLFKVLCSPSNNEQHNEGQTESKSIGDETSMNEEDGKAENSKKRDHVNDASTGLDKPNGHVTFGNENDRSSIGFDAIGDHPRHPMPGYPFVHRYGMVLNATPPVPHAKEMSYL